MAPVPATTVATAMYAGAIPVTYTTALQNSAYAPTLTFHSGPTLKLHSGTYSATATATSAAKKAKKKKKWKAGDIAAVVFFSGIPGLVLVTCLVWGFYNCLHRKYSQFRESPKMAGCFGAMKEWAWEAEYRFWALRTRQKPIPKGRSTVDQRQPVPVPPAPNGGFVTTRSQQPSAVSTTVPTAAPLALQAQNTNGFETVLLDQGYPALLRTLSADTNPGYLPPLVLVLDKAHSSPPVPHHGRNRCSNRIRSLFTHSEPRTGVSPEDALAQCWCEDCYARSREHRRNLPPTPFHFESATAEAQR